MFLPTSTVTILAWTFVLGATALGSWFFRRRWKELRHERDMRRQELAQARAGTEELEERPCNEALALEPDLCIVRSNGRLDDPEDRVDDPVERDGHRAVTCRAEARHEEGA